MDRRNALMVMGTAIPAVSAGCAPRSAVGDQPAGGHPWRHEILAGIGHLLEFLARGAGREVVRAAEDDAHAIAGIVHAVSQGRVPSLETVEDLAGLIRQGREVMRIVRG